MADIVIIPGGSVSGSGGGGGGSTTNLIQVAGVTLGAGAVTAFGTAPAAAVVPGVNASIFAGDTGVTATGTSLNVNLTNAAGPFTFVGNKSNNAVVPGATNLGVLPAIANAATQTWTEGDQVLISVDLSGRQRVRGTLTNNTAAPSSDALTSLNYIANAVAPTWTEGDLVLGSVDLNGNTRVIGTKTNNTAAPTTQVAVIPALANAANPTWIEGNQVLLSTDLSGNLRVTPTAIGTLTNNNAAPGTINIGTLPALANAVSPLWTEGNQVLESVDLHGGQRTIAGNIPEVTAAWTSATAQNTALTMTVLGYTSVIVTLSGAGGTITAGTVTFEVSDTTAFTNAYLINANGISESATLSIRSAFNVSPAGNYSFEIPVAGWAAVRVRLSTVITGTGTLTVGIAASAGASSPNIVMVGGGSLIGIQGGAVVSLADNQTTQTFIPSSTNTNEPLGVGDWVYGGAFSGTPNAALQGWSKMRTPTVFKTVSANSAVWTPGSGNKFRLLGLQITAQGLGATATGLVTVSFQDATTGITFGTYDVDIPAVASLISGTDEISGGFVNLGAFGILSAAANNVLNFNISSALTGAVGTYRVNVCGTEE